MVSSEVDRCAAREIALFASNDGTIYRQSIRPIILNLSRKKVAGTYERTLAVKAWEYAVKHAIERYSKEFGKIVLNPATRIACARELQAEWQSELDYTYREMVALKKAGKSWAMRG